MGWLQQGGWRFSGVPSAWQLWEKGLLLRWEQQDQGWDKDPWLCGAQCLRNALFMGSRVVMQASQTGGLWIKDPWTQWWSDIQEKWPFIETLLWPPEKILHSVTGIESDPWG